MARLGGFTLALLFTAIGLTACTAPYVGYIGSACSRGSSTDCRIGPSPTCAPIGAGDSQNGICTTSCTSDKDCDFSGVCVASPDGSGYQCLKDCSSADDCQDGFACNTVRTNMKGGQVRVCAPGCTVDADCDHGICDTLAGLCVSLVATAVKDPVSRDGGPDGGGGTDGGMDAGGMDAGPFDPETDWDVDGGFITLSFGASGVPGNGPGGGGIGGCAVQIPDPPQVVNAGGPVLIQPVIVPIFFSQDDADLTASLAGFYAQVGHSSFWNALREYGVGAATSAAPVTLDEAPPATVQDGTDAAGFKSWLESEVAHGNISEPVSGTLYVINYPASTTVVVDGHTSCTDFPSYHADVTIGGHDVAYALLPRCEIPPGANVAGVPLTKLQALTASASAVLANASTNPFPAQMPACSSVDQLHFFVEERAQSGEVADLCRFDPQGFHQFSDLPFVVQRLWSNTSVKKGHDPCVPTLPGQVFFNTVPVLSDSFRYRLDGAERRVLGVNVPVGKSKTIQLIGYSDQCDAGPWSVSVVDANTLHGQPANLQFALNSEEATFGYKINLTITVLSAGSDLADTFFVSSTYRGETHFSTGIVDEGAATPKP